MFKDVDFESGVNLEEELIKRVAGRMLAIV